MTSKLKTYALVAGIFVLGAASGAAAAYGTSERSVEAMFGDERPEAMESRRFFALVRELDLTAVQRRDVRRVLEQHKGESRRLTRRMFESCGEELRGLRGRVDDEIRPLLDERQRARFDHLSGERKRRFPLGRGARSAPPPPPLEPLPSRPVERTP